MIFCMHIKAILCWFYISLVLFSILFDFIFHNKKKKIQKVSSVIFVLCFVVIIWWLYWKKQMDLNLKERVERLQSGSLHLKFRRRKKNGKNDKNSVLEDCLLQLCFRIATLLNISMQPATAHIRTATYYYWSCKSK